MRTLRQKDLLRKRREQKERRKKKHSNMRKVENIIERKKESISFQEIKLTKEKRRNKFQKVTGERKKQKK